MILIQLPVAFCGGRIEKTWPVPGFNPAIRPRNTVPLPYMSETRSTGWPMRICSISTSRKLASTQSSSRGTRIIIESRGPAHSPTCTILFPMIPEAGARMLQRFKSRNACFTAALAISTFGWLNGVVLWIWETASAHSFSASVSAARAAVKSVSLCS